MSQGGDDSFGFPGMSLTTAPRPSIMQLKCKIADSLQEVGVSVPRTLETFVTRAAQQFPVVMLTGARQVGKTTLLRHLGQEGRAYVTLDDPLVLSLARRTRRYSCSVSRRPCSLMKSSMRSSRCPTSRWPPTAPESRDCSGSPARSNSI